MKTRLAMIAFAGGLIGYFAAGKRSSDRSVPPAGSPSGQSAGTACSSPPHVASAPTGGKHDLDSLIRWNRRHHSGGADVIGQIERMHTGAIRDLVVSLSIELHDSEGRNLAGFNSVFDAASDALYQREGDEALVWANQLPDARNRKLLLGCLVTSAARESPESAKPWIDRYQAEFGSDAVRPFIHAAICGATSRGMDELVRLRSIFGGLDIDISPKGPLPAHFDFSLMLEHCDPGAFGSRFAFQTWAARDRDAAWAGVRDLIAKDGGQAVRCMGPLFSGVAIADGELAAARWLASRLDEIPQDQRHQTLWDLLREGDGQSCAIPAILAELPLEADRLALVGGFLNNGELDTRAHAAALGALHSEALQLQAITRAAAHQKGMRSDFVITPKVLGYFTGLCEELRFGPASREAVLHALGVEPEP